MALAHQLVANRSLLPTPAPRVPRASISNARPQPLLGRDCRLTLLRAERRTLAVARASSSSSSSSSQTEPKSEGGEAAAAEGEEQPYEEYEVEILKPYGLKFAKGRDGGTYIEAILPGAAADQTGKFEVGDKVLATRSVHRFLHTIHTLQKHRFDQEHKFAQFAVLYLGRKSGRQQGTDRPCTASVRGLAPST
jgi:hypothetical protein